MMKTLVLCIVALVTLCRSPAIAEDRASLRSRAERVCMNYLLEQPKIVMLWSGTPGGMEGICSCSASLYVGTLNNEALARLANPSQEMADWANRKLGYAIKYCLLDAS